MEGFSKQYKCTRLVHFEGFDQAEKMIQREKQIKSWRREKKIALIQKANPRWQDLAERWAVHSSCQGKALPRKFPDAAWRYDHPRGPCTPAREHRACRGPRPLSRLVTFVPARSLGMTNFKTSRRLGN